MSRMTPGGPIVVRAQNNIYTALVGIAMLAALGAVIVVYMKGQQLDLNPFKM